MKEKKRKRLKEKRRKKSQDRKEEKKAEGYNVGENKLRAGKYRKGK